MHARALTFLALATAGLLAPEGATQFARTETKLNFTTLVNRAFRTASRGQAQIVSPRELMAADPARGLVPTANLAYTAWVEFYGGGYHLKFSRSTDGGRTWEAERILFFQAGSGWDFEQFGLAATEHQAWIAMSTGGPTSVWPNEIWLMGSEDQGRTWTQPIMANTYSSTIGRDADSIRVAASAGRCHVAYIYANPSNNNDLNQLFYIGAEFKSGAINIYKPDTHVNVNSALFVDGVQYFEIDADGPLVAICYNSPRLSGVDTGNLYVAVSRVFGSDFGSVANITQLTNYTPANPRTRTYWEPSLAVTKQNIYVVWGDNFGFPEWVSFSCSNNMGLSFSPPVVINPAGKAAGSDTDGPVVRADDKLVCVAWHDDRANIGASNRANGVYLAVDEQAGAGFINSTFQELFIDGPGAAVPAMAEYPSIDVRGDRIGLVYLRSAYDQATARPQDVAYVVSNDRGRTWSAPRMGSTRGSLSAGTVDVDDARLVFTANHDAIVWWADDRASLNDLYVAGFKLPELTYLGGRNGFSIGSLPSSAKNDLALILVTEAGTSPSLSLDNLGFTLQFAIGRFTPIFLSSQAYAAVVTSSQVLFPSAPDGLGIFHAIGLGIRPSTGWFSWFTDPVVY